jgi:hypothetical protein
MSIKKYKKNYNYLAWKYFNQFSGNKSNNAIQPLPSSSTSHQTTVIVFHWLGCTDSNTLTKGLVWAVRDELPYNIKLTDIMIQNLEKDLKTFHRLFSGRSCEAWRLEELIVRAIKSDHSKSERVIWIGRGHDVDKDVRIIEANGKINDIQIKSGKIKKVYGHRTGRFKEDLNEISNKYDTFLIPYREEVDKLGKRFIYQVFYED